MSEENLNSDSSVSRLLSRQSLVQFIVQMDFRSDSFEENLKKFSDYSETSFGEDNYFIKVAHGVCDEKENIDKMISGFMRKDWSLDRINKVVTAILEVAFYEILHCDDIPTSVSINEAVKLSKKFADNKDYIFVNGILSSFAKSLDN